MTLCFVLSVVFAIIAVIDIGLPSGLALLFAFASGWCAAFGVALAIYLWEARHG